MHCTVATDHGCPSVQHDCPLHPNTPLVLNLPEESTTCHGQATELRHCNTKYCRAVTRPVVNR